MVSDDEHDDDRTQTHVPLTKGTLISHYRIIEKIGAGGMGDVYLAEDTELNRKVALKFLPPYLCQEADCRARFKREAQAAAKLDHPNIVSVFEVGEFQGRPFFSMQHVEGQSLKEVLTGKTMFLDRILEVAIQVCEGLQTAHESGITHRDIKPSNILIDSRSRARIVDFGLASLMGSDHLTKIGSTLGTIGYMSPEQARGEEVDNRSDLFSFGVVLYEMITGRSPFKAESEIATIKNVIEAIPEPLARYKNGVPDELQRIVDKALSKDKNLRYQHADELSADLKRLISAVSTASSVPIRRHRFLVPSLIVFGVLVAVLVFRPWRNIIKSSEEAKTTTKRVVVVPFKNQTSDPSLDPLGKMVADWTTQGLLQTGLAEVVLPEMLSDLDASKGVRSVVDATGATLLVTGSYYKVGDSIQFQAQVLKADGSLVQAIEPTYAPSAKVMDGVESVRQRILGALMFVFDKRLEGAAEISRPPTYEAYLQYMQGSELFNKKIDYAGSIPYLKRAYALDTTFISPLIKAGAAYFNLGQLAQADSLMKILEPRRANLSPLLQLDLDEIRAYLAGDMMGALAATRAALKLASGWSRFYSLGWVAMRVNRPKEAVEAFKKVDPERTWVFSWSQLAEAYHLLGEHEKELASAREGCRRFPTSSVPYNAELEALAAMGELAELQRLIDDRPAFPQSGTPAGTMRYTAEELRAHGHEDEAMKLLDEAILWYESQPPEKLDSLRDGYALTLYNARRWDKAEDVYEELAKKSPKDSATGRGYETSLGLIAARQGDRTRAMEVSEWLRNLKVPYLFGSNTYGRACIAAILGEKEQAVALLKESFLQGKSFGTEIHKDFDFESLWDYPPFIEFLKPKGS